MFGYAVRLVEAILSAGELVAAALRRRTLLVLVLAALAVVLVVAHPAPRNAPPVLAAKTLRPVGAVQRQEAGVRGEDI